MTKKYYVVPVKKITAYNAKLNEKGRYEFDTNVDIIKEQEILYANFRGKLLSVESKFPHILDTELYDLLKNDFDRDINGTYSYSYIDTNEVKSYHGEVINNKNKCFIKGRMYKGKSRK